MNDFEAFLSYNSGDAAEAQELVQRLHEQYGISCWIDLWSLIPGRTWQEQLEATLREVNVLIFAIGKSGIGPWHNEEMRIAVDLAVGDSGNHRIIPVILPGARPDAEAQIPQFLRRFTCIDLRDGFRSSQFMRLAAGIRDQAPQAPSQAGPAPAASSPPELKLGNRERAAFDRLQADINAVRLWAQAMQNPDGGMPSDSPSTPSCTWASAGLLFAILKGTRAPADRWIGRSITWVLDNRNHDGGVPFITIGDPSITDATAQALLACAAYRRESGLGRREAAIGELADWLLGHQQPSGAWAWRPSRDVAWTASTAYGMLALAAAASTTGVRSDDITNALAEAKAWLWHSRNADGGWGSQAGDPSHPAITGLVAYCLAESGEVPADSESAQYLLRTQGRQGGWPDAIDRPTGLSIQRFGDAYGLMGLASADAYSRSEGVRRGYRALMRSFRGSYFEFRNTSMCVWPTRDSVLALSAVTQSILNGSAPRPQRNDPRVAE